MAKITLSLINRSKDIDNTQIIIFQKNMAQMEPPWQVIDSYPGSTQSIIYSLDYGLSTTDKEGNSSPILKVKDGEKYQLVETSLGNELQLDKSSSNPKSIVVENKLPQKSIDAFLYKDGEILSEKTGITSGKEWSFPVIHSITIGLLPKDYEIDIGNKSKFNDFTCMQEIELNNIKSAELVLTGGGEGPKAKPFQFKLQNIQKEK